MLLCRAFPIMPMVMPGSKTCSPFSTLPFPPWLGVIPNVLPPWLQGKNSRQFVKMWIATSWSSATSPVPGKPGHPHGARPRRGALLAVPGGRVFAHGAWLSPKKQHGVRPVDPPSAGTSFGVGTTKTGSWIRGWKYMQGVREIISRLSLVSTIICKQQWINANVNSPTVTPTTLEGQFWSAHNVQTSGGNDGNWRYLAASLA